MKFLLALALLVAAGSANAQSTTAWTYDISGPEVYTAEVSNESGGSFGRICYASSQLCYWVLVVDIVCDDKATYPLLANTEAGAYMLNLRCVHIGKTDKDKLLVFNEFEQVEKFVEAGGRVGFAVSMQGGNFRVVRFTLNGAKAAVAKADAAAVAAGSKSTKDMSL